MIVWIMDYEIYVGVKEEARQALILGYSVLPALNVAGEYPSHKTLVEYKTKVIKKDCITRVRRWIWRSRGNFEWHR